MLFIGTFGQNRFCQYIAPKKCYMAEFFFFETANFIHQRERCKTHKKLAGKN